MFNLNSIASKQFVTALKGLLVAAGPTVIQLAPTFGYDASAAERYLAAAVSVVGLVLLILDKSSTQIIADAAALPPAKQQQALGNIPAEAKVAIAEATPGVATVVVKDDAPPPLKELARGPNPNIVTETQNEADAKLGTKVPTPNG